MRFCRKIGASLADDHGNSQRALIIPVTLAFLESMVVRSRQRLFAIPIDVVHQVFKPDTAEIIHSSADQSEMIRRQDTLVPVNRLPHIFGNGNRADGDTGNASSQPEDAPLSDQVIVVVETSRGRFGLPVDEIVGE
jgi:chemotaxis protein histidine kinase CheA